MIRTRWASIAAAVLLIPACGDDSTTGTLAPDATSALIRTESAPPSLVSATTVVSIDLAPVGVAELEHRESLLRSSTFAPSFREVIESYESGTDWSGTLSGVILEDGQSWYVCVDILESLPLKCGAGVTLEGPGDEFAALSDDLVRSLPGTFDAETIAFVPDL